jgi:hypothetical protein
VRAAVAVAIVVALVGCVDRGKPRGGETITYRFEPTGLCMTCAGYMVTLGPDGQGIFTGDAGTAMAGDHRFRADSAAVQAFVHRLATYRPHGEVLMTKAPLCHVLSTDQNTVDVTWQAADAPVAHLRLYGGCDLDTQHKLIDAVFTAPALLPIAGMIAH